MRKYCVYYIFLFLCCKGLSITSGEQVIYPQSYGIFHSLKSVLDILRDVQEIFTIPEVKNININQYNNVSGILPKEGRKAFIVIEGVKGTGKSSTSRNFAKMVNGTYLRSPLNCLLEIRNNVIANRPRLIRSAFHALNNYLIAEKIKELIKTKTVVIDQYWQGLTAFSLSKMAGMPHNLPERNSDIYNFPTDLLKPDVAYLITVYDERRLYRLPDTGRPAVSKTFSDTINKAYKLMKNPELKSISGDRTREEILSDLMGCTVSTIPELL